jgi:DNA polymerase III epsilon subunit family exonuclease
MTEIAEEKTIAMLTGRPLDELEFVAFDVETTGLSAVACRVVELSGVRFRLGEGQETVTFSTLVNPGQPIPPEVAQIHGIDDAMVASAGTMAEILPQFREFCGDAVLIAHNASFDVEFLKLESLRNGQPLPANAVLDTLALAQQMQLDTINYKLKTLSEYFGFGGSQYHRALDDSFYVQKLFEKLVALGEISDFDRLSATGAVFSFNCEQRFAKPTLTAEQEKRLALIKAALEGGKQIRLVYESEFRSTRVVNPLAIMESRGSYYLTAYCTKSNAERTFRLDRIREAGFVGV